MATPGAATFTTYGPNAAAQGLAEAQAFNGGVAGAGSGGPAAYGSVPAPVQPYSTGPMDTSAAIGAGTQVYSQLPGYQNDLTTAGANISSELAGQLPSDVTAQLAESAAEGGVSTGGASGAAYLKALGLTSLGLENTGLSNLESLLPTLPGASIAGNPNLYVTPAQTYEAGVQNSVWGAAPQPAAAAAAGLAATQSGFGAGAGSVRPSPVAPATAPTAVPTAAPSPVTASGSGVDQGNAPGSPAALANWSDWYAQIMGTTSDQLSTPDSAASAESGD
jgi:hypothetical protein